MSNLEYKGQKPVPQPGSASSNEIFLRCPECLKLYVVALSSIQSQSPYFDCQVCETRFKLGADRIPGEIVGTERVSVEITKDLKECPKCGQMNPLNAAECSSCQVLFSKLRLSTAKNPNPSPLDIQWGQLINHFSDVGMHTRFVKYCTETDALAWALQKYRELDTLSGGDATCEGMIKKIMVLQADLKESRTQRLKRVSWSRIGYWTFLGLGFICMLAGFVSPNLKNMTGLGIAIWALAYGIGISIRGSMSLRDFFDPKV